MRMRDTSEGGRLALGSLLAVEFVEEVEERRVLVLWMWVSARVRAPAIAVVAERVEGEVVDIRFRREPTRDSWTRRKGR